MVTDATVPSLVLLLVLAAAVVLTRWADHTLRRRAALRTRVRPVAGASLRLPRVVLLDESFTATAA